MKKILILAMAFISFQQTFAQVKIDRTKRPSAGPAPVITLKDPVIFNMPNGMTVLVVENHKIPKVRAGSFAGHCSSSFISECIFRISLTLNGN